MACPDSNCYQTPVPSSWTFTANPNANRFCDPRLIGLAASDASMGLTLVAVDPVTGCLSQPNAPKGIYQHDPSRCLPDFIGPLDAPEFSRIPVSDATKSHWPAFLETVKDCATDLLRMVRILPKSSETGTLQAWEQEACDGSGSPVLVTPQLLGAGKQNTGGNCVSPKMLGYTSDTIVLTGGKVVTKYTWYSLDQWQQAIVDPVINADLIDDEDPADINLQFALWRTEGCSAGANKVKRLVGADWEQLQRLLNIGPEVIFEPWEEIYLQHKTASPITGITYFPAVNTPGSLPIVAVPDFQFNVKTLTGYLPRHTKIRLHVHVKNTTVTQFFDAGIAINGKEYARAAVASDNASNDNQNTFEMPIPADGILHINNFYQIIANSGPGSHLAVVYVLALIP